MYFTNIILLVNYYPACIEIINHLMKFRSHGSRHPPFIIYILLRRPKYNVYNEILINVT